LNFAIYSRKSVYTGKGESIENQIEMCKQYIFTKFPSATGAGITVYEDEGFSAKNTDRPQFRQMIADIRQKSLILSCVTGLTASAVMSATFPH
jgi:site-specific DNA recombinase